MTTSNNTLGSVSDLFLDQKELNFLTGIAKGANGKTRDELQCEQLLKMRVAFRVNKRGQPVVTHMAVQGQAPNMSNQPATQWKSNKG